MASRKAHVAVNQNNPTSQQNVLLCKAGKKHFIEELATPLYDTQRTLVGAVSVLRDVTEALQKSEQLAYAEFDVLYQGEVEIAKASRTSIACCSSVASTS